MNMSTEHTACLSTVVRNLKLTLANEDWQAVLDASDQLDQASLLSMLNAFSRCGLFTSESVSHSEKEILLRTRCAPPYRRLIQRWLRVLTEQGILEHRQPMFRVRISPRLYDQQAMCAAWDDVERLWRSAAKDGRTIEFAKTIAEHLPALISGEIQAVHLLFLHGDPALARAIYRESPAARYQHHAIAEFARYALSQRHDARPARVLEIGAGTGATTEIVKPRIADIPVKYLFTDVSRYFLSQAKDQFGQGDAMQYGSFNMDASPAEQGYEARSFDLIIVGGALNAARNTGQTLEWICSLLADGGWLLISEPTQEQYWVMASQAFMFSEITDDRLDQQSTFLTHSQWRAVLQDAHLELVADLPPLDHPLHALGHRVFAARNTIERGVCHGVI